MAVRKIFIAEISRTMMYVADCARTRSNRASEKEREKGREGGREKERERVTLRHRVRKEGDSSRDHLFVLRSFFPLELYSRIKVELKIIVCLMLCIN